MANKQKVELVTVFSGDTSKLNQSIKQIQSNLDKVKLPENLDKSFGKTLSDLSNAVKDFESKTASGLTKQSDLTALEKNAKKIQSLYQKLVISARNLGEVSDKEMRKLLPDDFVNQLNKANASFAKCKTSIEDSNHEIKAQQRELDRLIDKHQTLKKTLEDDTAKRKTYLDDKTFAIKQGQKQDLSRQRSRAYEKVGKLTTEMERRASLGYRLKGKEGNQTMDLRTREFEEEGAMTNKELNKALTAARKKAAEIETNFQKISAEIGDQKANSVKDIDQRISENIEKLKKQNDELETARVKLQELQSTSETAFSEMKADIEKITGLDLSSIKNTQEGMEQIKEAVSKLETDKIEKLRTEFAPLTKSIDDTKESVEKLDRGVDEVTESFSEMVAKENDINSLKHRVAEFFSLTSAVYLFRDAVRAAYHSVSELDAAMTETAVVTDFTIEDMWDQLPKYTDMANKLGVSTLGAYETMTLFYQQGLKTNEAFALGEEAMKMARIGNLDYADSTNKMTAALRGFNMELNQTSAQRVNDVYSELAAITAADTNEIATAMTKTASIAHSANMEFETTAAFLSQIIETTREAPETAGTAVKTVIARFQELKKAPDEIGEVDGEIVDANKIEAALRSVGVSLRDSTGQFRALDDVFLELSERWQTMDTNTQRYIATIAAGSRQQSRFLAMMSDYDRTMELVAAANNSAGASQKQYEKTLDSLESKVERLKNAWNQFTMGLTNSSLIKGGIDLITTLLNVVNKLTAGFDGLSGTILKVGALVYGRKVGKSVLVGVEAAMKGSNILDTVLGKNSDGIKSAKEGGETAGKAFRAAFKNSMSKKSFSIADIISNIKQKAKYEPESFYQVAIGGMRPVENNESYLSKHQRFLDLLNQEAAYKKANTTQQVAFNQAVRNGLPVQEASNLLTKQGVMFSAQVRIATLLSTAATKLETKGIIANTTAKKINAAATKFLAMGSLKAAVALTGIVGGLALATVGVVYLYKKAKENSLAEQMKRAEESTRNAQEAVSEITEAYNNLKDSIESIRENDEALDHMVEGTQEWLDKVTELNSQVMELIKLYPELASKVKFDPETGRIENPAEIFEEVQQREQARVQRANAVKAISESQEQRLGLQKTANELVYNRTYDQMGVEVDSSSVSMQDLAALTTALGKFPDLFLNMDEIDNRLGSEIDPLLLDYIKTSQDGASAVEELTQQSLALEKSTSVLNTTLTNQHLLQNPQIQGSEAKGYITSLIEGITGGKNTTGEYANKYNNSVKRFSGMGIADYNKEVEKYAKSVYGENFVSSSVSGNEVSIVVKNGETEQTITLQKDALTGQLAEEALIKNIDVQALEVEAKNKLDSFLRAIGLDPETATDEQRMMAQQTINASAANGSNIYDLKGFSLAELRRIIDSDNSQYYEPALASYKQKVADNKATAETSVMDIKGDVSSQLAKNADALGLNNKALDNYVVKLEESNALLRDGELATEAIANENLKLHSTIQDLNKVLDEEADALDLVDSPEYWGAIEKVGKSLSDLLGIQLDSSYIADHLDVIKAAADGATDAIVTLRKEAAIEQLMSLNVDFSQLDMAEEEFWTLINEFDGYQIEAGTNIETAPAFQAMQALLDAGQITSTQMNKILSNMGVVPKISYEWVDAPNPTPYQPGSGMRETDWKLSTRQIKVPRIEYVAAGSAGLDTSLPTPPDRSSGGGGRSSKAEKEPEPYKNSFDRYYNLVEDINEELRVRNKLEEEYNDLINNSDTSAVDILDNLSKQEASLNRQAKLQKQMMDYRRSQLSSTMSEYSDLQGYANYNFSDMTVEIDWGAINSVTDADKGARIEEYVSKLEQLQSQMDEANDALTEIDNSLEEIKDRGKDQFLDLEQKVLDAVINKYQQQIDALNNINTSINNANTQLMQAVQETLAQQRLDDQNAETEQNLADMQRRLDYLKQDTSNANALEIKQLEKQLEDAQEDYTNALIDQKLTEIEDQNQKAAEAREKQIQIAQSQLQHAQETGALWKEVEDLLLNGTDSSGSLIIGSNLAKILKDSESWDSLSDIGKKEWFDSLEKLIAQGFAWLGKLKPSDDTPFSQAIKDKLGVSSGSSSGGSNSGGNSGSSSSSKPNLSVGSRVTVKPSHRWYEDSYGGGEYGYSNSGQAVQITYTNMRGSHPYHVATLSGNPLGWLKKEDLVGYKTGGIADFTGPAWLDGTKSHPELILNQKDTENFIQLKNILADAFKGDSGSSENIGEAYYDIDINIENVGSQEDIDNIIDQIERRITSVARYRNVNNLSIKR